MADWVTWAAGVLGMFRLPASVVWAWNWYLLGLNVRELGPYSLIAGGGLYLEHNTGRSGRELVPLPGSCHGRARGLKSVPREGEGEVMEWGKMILRPRRISLGWKILGRSAGKGYYSDAMAVGDWSLGTSTAEGGRSQEGGVER